MGSLRRLPLGRLARLCPELGQRLLGSQCPGFPRRGLSLPSPSAALLPSRRLAVGRNEALELGLEGDERRPQRPAPAHPWGKMVYTYDPSGKLDLVGRWTYPTAGLGLVSLPAIYVGLLRPMAEQGISLLAQATTGLVGAALMLSPALLALPIYANAGRVVREAWHNPASGEVRLRLHGGLEEEEPPLVVPEDGVRAESFRRLGFIAGSALNSQPGVHDHILLKGKVLDSSGASHSVIVNTHRKHWADPDLFLRFFPDRKPPVRTHS